MIAALTSGIMFLPPNSRRVYMPTRKARSCRKKISAMVADGRHSTGLTEIPWKILAITRFVKFGALAHQQEVITNMTAEAK
jgi:hypothetical protein